jgi:hypothetical protein
MGGAILEQHNDPPHPRPAKDAKTCGGYFRATVCPRRRYISPLVQIEDMLKKQMRSTSGLRRPANPVSQKPFELKYIQLRNPGLVFFSL